MARKLEVEIVGDASSLHRAVGQADSATSKLGRGFSRLGKMAAVGFGAVVVGGAIAMNKAVDAASNLNESVNAVRVVFGKGSKQVLAFSKGASKLGLSMREANELVTPVGAGLRNAGLSMDEAAKKSVSLAKRAADMASVFNTSVPEALQAIQAGLRGEADPLERFGVGLTDAAVKAKGVSMGFKLVKGNLDPAAKAQARYALIMEQTNKLQGDFSRTSGGMANQQRILKAELENSAAAIGQWVLPLKTKVVSFIAGTVIPTFDRLRKKIGQAKGFRAKLDVIWEGVQGAATTLTHAIRDAVAKIDWQAAWSSAQGISEGLQARLAAVNWQAVGATIGAGLVTGVQVGGDVARKLATVLLDTARLIDWTKLGKAMGPGLAAALATAFVTITDPSFWIKNWDLALAVGLVVFKGKIAEQAGKLGAAVAAPFVRLGGSMVLAIAGGIERVSPRLAGAFVGALGKLPALVGRLLGALVGPVRSQMGRLSGVAKFVVTVLGVQAAINLIGSLVGKARDKFNQLRAYLKNYAGNISRDASAIGMAIVNGIIAGIGSLAGAIGKKLLGEVQSAFNGAKRWLQSQSPSRRAAKELGKPIGDGIALGIKQSEMAVINALRDVLTRAIRGKNFGDVSSVIQSMFGAVQGAQRTPSERKIASLERMQQLQDLNQGITDAARSVTDAQQALQEAMAGGDRGAIQDAQRNLDQALRDQQRAKEALELFHLQEKAAKERARLDAKQLAQQIQLGATLDRLGKLFDKHHITIGALLAAVRRILHGLHVPGYAKGGVVMRPTLAMVGEAGPEAIVPLNARGNGNGGKPVQVNLQIDGRTLASLLLDPLRGEVRQLRQAGGSFLGRG